MDIELSEEQTKRIASNIFIGDVLTYINEHQTDYKEFLNEELKKGNLSKEELDYELKNIKKIKEVKNA